jgi:hypothetical protein
MVLIPMGEGRSSEASGIVDSGFRRNQERNPEALLRAGSGSVHPS